MPRLSPRLIARARKENPLLPLLLRPCRDLESARRELRWLKDHARSQAKSKPLPSWEPILNSFCRRRSLGEPLQYIFGTEFFGELELRCSPGVLIPRQDTAAYVLHLLGLLKRNGAWLPAKLRVLDLCTGSGCIPILFGHSFESVHCASSSLTIMGVDVSKSAIELAKTNKQEQSLLAPGSAVGAVEFVRADILSEDSSSFPEPLLDYLDNQEQKQWDIMISNPPYVSPKQFNHLTARSVRNFEPKLALVPDSAVCRLSDSEHGDLFYPRLLKLSRELNTKVLLMEVGDLEQAKRVTSYALADKRWSGHEIWRDDPGAADEKEHKFGDVHIRGQGNGRSVLCWTKDAIPWLGV